MCVREEGLIFWQAIYGIEYEVKGENKGDRFKNPKT